ncbi:MAG TPA: hypothetical protein VMS11_07285 [Solirubrobacterales bacterium]|nr:hypothetical protein [Solirubrobacterales bacterium]
MRRRTRLLLWALRRAACICSLVGAKHKVARIRKEIEILEYGD